MLRGRQGGSHHFRQLLCKMADSPQPGPATRAGAFRWLPSRSGGFCGMGRSCLRCFRCRDLAMGPSASRGSSRPQGAHPGLFPGPSALRGSSRPCCGAFGFEGLILASQRGLRPQGTHPDLRPQGAHPGLTTGPLALRGSSQHQGAHPGLTTGSSASRGSSQSCCGAFGLEGAHPALQP